MNRNYYLPGRRVLNQERYLKEHKRLEQAFEEILDRRDSHLAYLYVNSRIKKGMLVRFSTEIKHRLNKEVHDLSRRYVVTGLWVGVTDRNGIEATVTLTKLRKDLRRFKHPKTLYRYDTNDLMPASKPEIKEYLRINRMPLGEYFGWFGHK